MMCRRNLWGITSNGQLARWKLSRHGPSLYGRAHTVWLARPKNRTPDQTFMALINSAKIINRVIGYAASESSGIKNTSMHTHHSINIDIYLTICRPICGGRPHNIRLFIRRPRLLRATFCARCAWLQTVSITCFLCDIRQKAKSIAEQIILDGRGRGCETFA